MNVLVTGASGFVGVNLIPYLKKCDHQTHSLKMMDPEWKQNIPDNLDAVIHLAGKAHDTQNVSKPEDYFRVNAELTKALYDVFLKGGARDFIYFSSVKAAADSVSDVLEESVVPDPRTPYGQSKLAAEQYILAQPLPAGKRAIIIRPCMIHGPGNKGNLNLLYKFVAKGAPYPLAAFENKRSFLSVDNLCFAINEILQNEDVPGGVYNISDDKPLSTNEIVRCIAAVLNKKPALFPIPKLLINGVARFGSAIGFPFNKERLKKLTENYVVSNKKIKAALAIESFPLSVEDGLAKTIRSFSAQ